MTEFIILGNHAFSIVEELGFKQMIRSVSNVEIPIRNTVKKDIIQLYVSFKIKLIEVLKDINCNIAITTDIWTSLSNDPYVAVTVHFSEMKNYVMY